MKGQEVAPWRRCCSASNGATALRRSASLVSAFVNSFSVNIFPSAVLDAFWAHSSCAAASALATSPSPVLLLSPASHRLVAKIATLSRMSPCESDDPVRGNSTIGMCVFAEDHQCLVCLEICAGSGGVAGESKWEQVAAGGRLRPTKHQPARGPSCCLVTQTKRLLAVGVLPTVIAEAM